jgi:hypothetical protein
MSFSWNHEFKVLRGGSFPVILGLDFMDRTGVLVDVASQTFSFRFAPGCRGLFCLEDLDVREGGYLQHLLDEALQLALVWEPGPSDISLSSLVAVFSALFLSTLGAAKCALYKNQLSDPTPVRSSPYWCTPPKLKIFREMIDDLLEKGVVTPSKSPYVSPAFLLPKRGGGFRMVVDYRKVNAKVVFNSYPMPTIKQAFEQFGGAVVFSVLELNSAYYKITFSFRSRQVTAFCTPFGPFEFNKLLMGISVGCQGLSRVIVELFVDLKGKYVF